ncbi:MAG TPA: sorbosone dehydrogenase family protein, partial [Gammaproteobacteria bacterium]|nr:sorbosone dehydrogenase family protein [Gammaproteobacteria bacterium]
MASLPACAARPLPLHTLHLPPGFHISLVTDQVPDARSMTFGARGTLFVGTREAGKVYAVVDRDGDGRADRVYTLLTGLDMPNGVAFRNGSLYVAEVSRVLRLDR